MVFRNSLSDSLVEDLRGLSAEARRADGLISGWLTGPDHPQVREAAERAVLRLRSASAQPDAMEVVQSRVSTEQ
jgi:hypothetical protein